MMPLCSKSPELQEAVVHMTRPLLREKCRSRLLVEMRKHRGIAAGLAHFRAAGPAHLSVQVYVKSDQPRARDNGTRQSKIFKPPLAQPCQGGRTVRAVPSADAPSPRRATQA